MRDSQDIYPAQVTLQRRTLDLNVRPDPVVLGEIELSLPPRRDSHPELSLVQDVRHDGLRQSQRGRQPCQQRRIALPRQAGRPAPAPAVPAGAVSQCLLQRREPRLPAGPVNHGCRQRDRQTTALLNHLFGKVRAGVAVLQLEGALEGRLAVVVRRREIAWVSLVLDQPADLLQPSLVSDSLE